jgi:hypothetical protein
MFRVKAVNDEGESEPLESDAAIQAKDPYGEAGLVQARHQHVEQTVFLFLQLLAEMHAICLKCLMGCS